MAYDLVIKNGTVVDGTGAPRVRADVAIKDGTIAEIGKVSGGAQRTIDAGELIVAPGFVDPHTHYDAQICWDPLLTCTSWHGVTSVVMGNCGVGIAPCKPEVHEIAAWDLVNVEAIPFDALSKGITWDWVSFPEFMDAAARRGVGINVGFLAPLTPFRHFVMGEESMERAASPNETQRIAALLHEAMAAGAMGFSTTTLAQHIGFRGQPLACRLASRDELKACSNVLKELGKGSIEIALTRRAGQVLDDEYQLLDFLLTESARPVTWLAMASRPDKPEYAEADAQAPGAADQARRRAAGPVQAVRGADRSAQSLQLRRHGGVEPRLQSAARSAEADLRRPGVSRFVPQGADAAASVQRQMASRRSARSLEPRAQAAGAQKRRRNRRRARPRPARHVPRPRARRRPQYPVHDGAVSRGGNRAADWRSAHDARALRRRRARRHAVRRRVLHLPARQLGARAPGDDARARGQAHHVGAGRFLRHPAARAPAARTRRRHHDLRLQHRRLGQARADAARSAGRRTAPGDARRGYRVHGRQRAACSTSTAARAARCRGRCCARDSAERRLAPARRRSANRPARVDHERRAGCE